MASTTLEPRTADELTIDDSLIITDIPFEELAANDPQACVSTCVSGFTFVCDGSTFSRTCVTGWTFRCDG